MSKIKHTFFLDVAFEQAERAYQSNEVPVGAVIVQDNVKIVSCGYNMCEKEQSPLLHAEINAIQAMPKELLQDPNANLSMYVTLEPCLMCIGALAHTHIKKIFYAVKSEKTGACSVVQLPLWDKQSVYRAIPTCVHISYNEDVYKKKLQEFFR